MKITTTKANETKKETVKVSYSYEEVRTATNRYILTSGYITVVFFDGDTGTFEAEFIKDEIVTDDLTIDKIVDNLTETSFGGWHTIAEVHDLTVEQIFNVVRTYDDGKVTEYETSEIVLDEPHLVVAELEIA